MTWNLSFEYFSSVFHDLCFFFSSFVATGKNEMIAVRSTTNQKFNYFRSFLFFVSSFNSLSQIHRTLINNQTAKVTDNSFWYPLQFIWDWFRLLKTVRKAEWILFTLKIFVNLSHLYKVSLVVDITRQAIWKIANLDFFSVFFIFMTSVIALELALLKCLELTH